MVPAESRNWQHPWLRVQRVLRTILTEEWCAEAWQQLRPEIPKVIPEQSRITRAGWFN